MHSSASLTRSPTSAPATPKSTETPPERRTTPFATRSTPSGLPLTAEGYRVDRAHSFVIANALTTLQRDYALPERHARALRVRLIGSPPFAEDRLPLPALLEPAWNAALGVIPA